MKRGRANVTLINGIENLRTGKFIIKEEDGFYKLYEN